MLLEQMGRLVFVRCVSRRNSRRSLQHGLDQGMQLKLFVSGDSRAVAAIAVAAIAVAAIAETSIAKTSRTVAAGGSEADSSAHARHVRAGGGRYG